MIVTGAHGTVTKELKKRLEDLEIKGRVGTIQTIASLNSAWILRRALELTFGVKNSQISEINNNVVIETKRSIT